MRVLAKLSKTAVFIWTLKVIGICLGFALLRLVTGLKTPATLSIWSNQKYSGVESRFFEPPGETKLGLKNRVVREIRVKITVFKWGNEMTFGWSYREVRRNEGSRNRNSTVKPKPIGIHSHTFSRALCQLHVLTLSFAWFTGLLVSFATLNLAVTQRLSRVLCDGPEWLLSFTNLIWRPLPHWYVYNNR